MVSPGDLSVMLAWPKGRPRWIAMERLRANGVRIGTREGGNMATIGFYTDRDFRRAALILRSRSGRVQVKPFGCLTRRESAYLHVLASQVPSPPK